MGFNYGFEKRKFDRVWEKLHREYIEAGMDETAILSMYEFDWETFKKERTYRNHTQPIPEQRYEDDGDSAGDDNSPLMDKFHSLSSGAPRSPVPGGAIHPTENAKLLLARR